MEDGQSSFVTLLTASVSDIVERRTWSEEEDECQCSWSRAAAVGLPAGKSETQTPFLFTTYDGVGYLGSVGGAGRSLGSAGGGGSLGSVGGGGGQNSYLVPTTSWKVSQPNNPLEINPCFIK